jgi:L-ascorbate metabolism protein UlaG (beta-lactamase superfamily)
MKQAFARDAAFLENVRNALSAGRTAMWWLGQSGFLFVNKGRAFITDPYLSDSLTRKYQNTDKPHIRITERVVDPRALGETGVVDVITSSHAHTDHFDAETLAPLLAANPQAKLLIPAANHEIAKERLGAEAQSRLVEVDAGGSVEAAGIRFHAIASEHPDVERDSAGHCKFLGYVIQWAGRTIYHSGDTLMHDGLVPALKKFTVDLAILPINGNLPERRVAGNLDGREAARLAREIGAKSAIPCHYDLFEFNTATTDEFVAECDRVGQQYKVLQNGEGMEI